MQKVNGEKINLLAKNQGITVMALVITIIVLLMLAGISINMLTGENGLIKNARECKRPSRNR